MGATDVARRCDIRVMLGIHHKNITVDDRLIKLLDLTDIIIFAL